MVRQFIIIVNIKLVIVVVRVLLILKPFNNGKDSIFVYREVGGFASSYGLLLGHLEVLWDGQPCRCSDTATILEPVLEFLNLG